MDRKFCHKSHKLISDLTLNNFPHQNINFPSKHLSSIKKTSHTFEKKGCVRNSNSTFTMGVALNLHS